MGFDVASAPILYIQAILTLRQRQSCPSAQ